MKKIWIPLALSVASIAFFAWFLVFSSSSKNNFQNPPKEAEVLSESATVQAYILLDSTPPILYATDNSSTWFNYQRVATVIAYDPVHLEEVRYNWGSYTMDGGCTSGGTITDNGEMLNAPEEGITLYLCARDTGGNVATWEGLYRWETTAPSTPGILTTTWVGDHYVTSAFTGSSTGSTDTGGSGLASYTLFMSNDYTTETPDCNISIKSGLLSPTYIIGSENPVHLPENGFRKLYCWVAIDNAGNSSLLSATEYIRMDNLIPTTAVTIANAGYSPATFIDTSTINGTATDTGGAGIANVQITIFNGTNYWSGSSWGALTWLPVSGTTTWTYSIDDSVAFSSGLTYTVIARATDNAGNTTTSGFGTDSFLYDSTAPSEPAPLTLHYPVSSPGNITTPIILAEGVVSGDTIRIYVDGACATPVGSAVAGGTSVEITSSALTQATYIFHATSTDPLGNVSECSTSTVTYVLDTTKPTTAVTITAENYNPYTYEDAYTINGTANDTGGAILSNVQITVFNGAAYWTGTAWGAATWLNAFGTSSWTYTLDDVNFADDYTYTVTARATDTAGNTTTSGYGVDSFNYFGFAPEPPTDLVLVNPLTSPGNITTPTIGVGGVVNGDLITLYTDDCVTPVGSSTAAGSTVNIITDTLTQGVYTFKANSRDPSGNLSSCSVDSVTYILDTTKPTTNVTIANPSYGPISFVHESTINGTASDSGGAVVSSVSITIYNGNDYWQGSSWGGTQTWLAVTTGTTIWSFTMDDINFTNGLTYTVTARATDSASNITTSGFGTDSFVYDNVSPSAPTPLILNNPSTSPGNDTTPTINVGGVANGDLVKLFTDGTCTTPVGSATAGGSSVNVTSSILTQNSYTFNANSTDSAGNVSACSSATVNYVLDTTNPTTTVTIAELNYGPGTFVDESTINGSASDTGGATVASVQITLQRSVDSWYWNGSSWVATLTWLDVTSGTGTWTYTINDLTAPFQNAQIYTVVARATDTAGNTTSSGYGSDSFTYYNEAPSTPTHLTLHTPSTSPGNISTPIISVHGVSAGDTITLYNDNCTTIVGSVVATGDPANITTIELSQGTYVFKANARDEYGNISGCTTNGLTYILDLTPPTTTVTISNAYYGPNTYNASTINGHAADTGGATLANVQITIQRSGDSLYWTGSNWGALTWLTAAGTTNWTYNLTVGNLTNALEYTVVARATDTAGNTTSSGFGTDSFIYDNVAPTTPGVMTTTWVGDHYVNTSFVADTSGSTDIGGSGVNSYAAWRSIDGSSTCNNVMASGIGSTSYSVSGGNLPSNGQIRYYCWTAIDNAGNTSTISVGEYIRMDNTLPISYNVVENGFEPDTITLTANVVDPGGSPLTYEWFSDATCSTLIIGETANTYDMVFPGAPADPITYSYKAYDLFGASGCATAQAIWGNVAPTVSVGNDGPKNENNTITFTAYPSDAPGTTFTYQWYTDVDCNSPISGATASSRSEFSAEPATVQRYVVVEDNYHEPSICTASGTAWNNVAPGANNVSSSVNEATNLTLTSIVSDPGGTVFTYQWYSDSLCNTPIGGQTGSTYVVGVRNEPTTETYYYKTFDAPLPTSLSSNCATATANWINVAPTAQNVSNSVNEGTSLTLTANATDPGNTLSFTYQWYTGLYCSTPISGETDSTYVAGARGIPVVENYSYKAFDAQSLESNCATAVATWLNIAPVATNITGSGNEGSAVILTANASDEGGDPLTYQWFGDATCSNAESGEVDIVYYAPSQNEPNSIIYSYKAYDTELTASNCALATATWVNVNPAVSVSNDGPKNENTAIVFAANPSDPGGTTYTYQWYSNAICTSEVPGAVYSTRSENLTEPGTVSRYVVVKDAQNASSSCVGSTATWNNVIPTASNVTHTVNEALNNTLTANPSDPGSSTFTYQWYSDSTCTTEIIGQTSSTYSAGVQNEPTLNVYSYKAWDLQSTETNCATATAVWSNVAPTATNLTGNADEPDTITFSAVASDPGGSTFTYQWYSDGVCSAVIVGENGITYDAVFIPSNYTGTYSYKVFDAQGLSSNCATASATWNNLGPAILALVKPANNVWVNDREFCATVYDPGSGLIHANFVIGVTTYVGTTVMSGSDSCYTHTEDINNVSWYAYVVDGDDLHSPNSVTWIAKIDTVPPGTPTMVAEPEYTAGTSNTVTSGSTTDSGVGGVRYNFCINTTDTTIGCSQSGWQVSSSYTFTGLIGGQRYYYYVQARDALGNTSVWSTIPFTYTTSIQDDVLPLVSATNSSPTWLNAQISAVISASDAGVGLAQIRYSWGSNAMNGTCTTGGTIITSGSTLLAPSGGTTLFLCARDIIGNTNTWSGVYNWDNAAPTLFASNSSSNWVNYPLLATITAIKSGGSELVEVRYSWGTNLMNLSCDGFGGGTITSHAADLVVPVGYTVLYLCARDTANNVSTWNGSYHWESTAPSVPGKMTTTWAGDHFVRTTFVAGSAGSSDTGGSGVATYTLWRSSDYTGVSTGCSIVVQSGVATPSVIVGGSNLPTNGFRRDYCWTATDYAGNTSGMSIPEYIWMDNVAPTTSVTIANATYDYTNFVHSNTIRGTAIDNFGGSGVTSVNIRLFNGTNYWTGSAWGVSTWLSATGTTSWTYAINDNNFTEGLTYTVTARAWDVPGNVTSSGFGSDSFIYTGAEPITPTPTATITPILSNTPVISITNTPTITSPDLTITPTLSVTKKLTPTVIISILPPTGENCTIYPPQIVGDTDQGYNLTFTVDSNEEINCQFSLGTNANNLSTEGLSILNSVEKMIGIIPVEKLPKDTEAMYQLVCQSSLRECSYTNTMNIDWPANENIIKVVETETTAAGLVGLTVASVTFSFPQIFWLGMLWIYRRSKKNRYGMVYDESTKLPVAFAVVRLLDGITGKSITQTITDIDGRYDLLSNPGDYILEVSQDSYKKFNSPVTLSREEAQITLNIGLRKSDQLIKDKINYRKILRKINKYIFIFGFGFSLLMMVLNFYIINILIVAFYLIQIFFLYVLKPPRTWGRVIEAGTGNVIKGAFISVLDTIQKRQVDIQISDAQGRFGFILRKQSYLLKVNAPGYKPLKTNKYWRKIILPGGDITFMMPKGEAINLDIEMEKLKSETKNTTSPQKFAT